MIVVTVIPAYVLRDSNGGLIAKKKARGERRTFLCRPTRAPESLGRRAGQFKGGGAADDVRRFYLMLGSS